MPPPLRVTKPVRSKPDPSPDICNSRRLPQPAFLVLPPELPRPSTTMSEPHKNEEMSSQLQVFVGSCLRNIIACLFVHNQRRSIYIFWSWSSGFAAARPDEERQAIPEAQRPLPLGAAMLAGERARCEVPLFRLRSDLRRTAQLASRPAGAARGRRRGARATSAVLDFLFDRRS